MRPHITCALIVFGTLSAIPSIRAQTAPAASADQTVKLDPFTVAASSTIGYLSTNSTSATRFATDSRDLSMTIDVIDSQRLQDGAFTDLNSSLADTVAGLQPGSIPRQSIIRGMASDYPLRNGVPTFGLEDVAYLDRIEVLQGSDGVLYGVTQPGGVRNLISKQPQFQYQSSISQQADTFHGERTVVDTTGPIGSGDKLAFRLIGVYNDYFKYADYQFEDDRLLYPSLLWRPTKKTSILFDGTYMYYNNNGLTAYPLMRLAGSTVNRFVSPLNSGLNLPYSVNIDGPSGNEQEWMRGINIILKQEISSNWALQATYSWQEFFAHQDEYVQNSQLAPGGTVFNKYAYEVDQRFPQEFYRADLLGTFEEGWFTDRVLIGGDSTWRLNNTLQNRAATYNAATGKYTTTLETVDLRNYSTPTLANNWLYDFSNFTNLQPVFNDSKNWDIDAGAYVVDQFELNRSQSFIIAGLRFDRIKEPIKTLYSSYVYTNTYTAPVGERVSPQLGLSQRINSALSLYGDVSYSVYPNTVVNPDGTGFPPQYGQGFELGLKVDTKEHLISGSFAAYRTYDENLPIANPAAATNPALTGYYVLEGKTESQGFASSWILTPVRQWQITLQYTYIDAFNTLTNVQLPSTAKNNYTIWTRYDFDRGMLKGLAVGGGAVFNSNVYTGNAAPQDVYNPARTIGNLFAAYSGKIWDRRYRIQANLKNLTNYEHIDDFNHPLGIGRELLISVKLDY